MLLPVSFEGVDRRDNLIIGRDTAVTITPSRSDRKGVIAADPDRTPGHKAGELHRHLLKDMVMNSPLDIHL